MTKIACTVGGRIGYRRCLVNSTYIPCKRHYYYADFLQQHRDQSQPRTAE